MTDHKEEKNNNNIKWQKNMHISKLNVSLVWSVYSNLFLIIDQVICFFATELFTYEQQVSFYLCVFSQFFPSMFNSFQWQFPLSFKKHALENYFEGIICCKGLGTISTCWFAFHTVFYIFTIKS